MAGRKFRFNLATAQATVTEAIASIDAEESADGQTGFAPIPEPSNFPVGVLADDGDKKLLDAATADPAKYIRLIPRTASGVVRQAARIYPPLPAVPETWTLIARAGDAGPDPVEGVRFSARPKRGKQAAAGEVSVVEKRESASAANGDVSLVLRSDAGVYEITLGNETKNVDTTGRAGTVAYWTTVTTV